MEVFLADSWDLKKQDEQIESLRQAEQGSLFHLSNFIGDAIWSC